MNETISCNKFPRKKTEFNHVYSCVCYLVIKLYKNPVRIESSGHKLNTMYFVTWMSKLTYKTNYQVGPICEMLWRNREQVTCDMGLKLHTQLDKNCIYLCLKIFKAILRDMMGEKIFYFFTFFHHKFMQ